MLLQNVIAKIFSIPLNFEYLHRNPLPRIGLLPNVVSQKIENQPIATRSPPQHQKKRGSTSSQNSCTLWLRSGSLEERQPEENAARSWKGALKRIKIKYSWLNLTAAAAHVSAFPRVGAMLLLTFFHWEICSLSFSRDSSKESECALFFISHKFSNPPELERSLLDFYVFEFYVGS